MKKAKFFRRLCRPEMLKVYDFLSSDNRDWSITEISKKGEVSRTVIYNMIDLKILKKTRHRLYQLNL